MKTKTGKIISRLLIALLLIAIPAVVVWAVAPPDNATVDGKLDPDNEYNEEDCEEYGPDNNPGLVQQGDYSKCYGRYVPSEGLYICNDWYLPEENYDPNDECDGMNQFDWTDKGFSPNFKYWRIQVHGDSTVNVKWRWQGGGPSWTEITNPNADGWEQATGYVTSKNDPNTEHPIWELLIPESEMSEDGPIVVGIVDPKYIDPNDCPSAEDPEYAPAPPIDSNDFDDWYPTGGGGC